MPCALPSENAGGPLRILRGEFHRHSEISTDGGNDGTIIDQYRYMLDTPAWIGSAAAITTTAHGARIHLVDDAEADRHLPHSGHVHPDVQLRAQRAVSRRPPQRGLRPARHPPPAAPARRLTETRPGNAPDTQMLYRYLRKFNGIVASHTSGTNMGTDWRDNDPTAEPVVEIYQGDRQNYEMPGAPRSNNEKDSIGGWRPKGFVNLALEKGYKLAFQASSDHISTHMSYCNLLATDRTREALLEAFQKRHVYGATDDILAEFAAATTSWATRLRQPRLPALRVKLTGTAPFAKVHVDQRTTGTSTPSSRRKRRWNSPGRDDDSPKRARRAITTSAASSRTVKSSGSSPMWIT